MKKPKTTRRKRPAKSAPTACFYDYETCGIWQVDHVVKTADQGTPEPVAFEGSGWDYQPNLERAGRIIDRVPNAGEAT